MLLDAVLEALKPKPGETALDCTLGFGGHSLAIAERLGPAGRLIALDRDADNLARANETLAAVGLARSLRITPISPACRPSSPPRGWTAWTC